MNSPRLTLCILACISPIAAHGGGYRGPATPMPQLSGPTTGIGPKTSPVVVTVTADDWRIWWAWNQEPFLRLKDTVHSPGRIGATHGFHKAPRGGQRGTRLSSSRTSTIAVDSYEPTRAEKTGIILPALKRLLDDHKDPLLHIACMTALAKIGLDHKDFELLPILRRHMTASDPQVRDCAVLCLGISRRAAAFDDLRSIAEGGVKGCRLLGIDTIPDRTRTLAVYGLGLIARARRDLATTGGVLEVCRELLAETSTEALRIAASQGLSLLRLDPEQANDRRVLWHSLNVLWGTVERQGSAQRVQAHALTAIARLLGRGKSADHECYKGRIRDLLNGKLDRHVSLYRASVLALGQLALPPEHHATDKKISEALWRFGRRTKDPLGQHLAMIALAQIGGEENRGKLIVTYRRCRRAGDKTWLALALGIIANGEKRGGSTDTLIGPVLERSFKSSRTSDTRAAIAIAIGLCGYREAAEAVKRQLAHRKTPDSERTHLATSLALLDDLSAIPALRVLLDQLIGRPSLVGSVAVALGKLGDKYAMNQLESLLAGSTNVARTRSLANAYELIGDRRAISPIVRLLADSEVSLRERALLAQALGGIADQELTPWITALSVGQWWE